MLSGAVQESNWRCKLWPSVPVLLPDRFVQRAAALASLLSAVLHGRRDTVLGSFTLAGAPYCQWAVLRYAHGHSFVIFVTGICSSYDSPVYQ